MIPVELGEASWRPEHFNEQSNGDNLHADLDMVQEVREEARIRTEAAKLRAARRYNTPGTKKSLPERGLGIAESRKSPS